MTLTCAQCGKSFEKLDSAVRHLSQKRRNRFFCSRSCSVTFSNFNRLSKYTISKAALEDRELVSYFLGFCYGDGSYAKGVDRLTVYSTDEQIIHDLTIRFGYSRPYRVAKKAGGRFKTLWSNEFYANNARLFRGMGLVSDKTKIRWEDFDVEPISFLRGLMDSDGSFSRRAGEKGFPLDSVYFLAQPSLLTGLQAFLSKLSFYSHISFSLGVSRLSLDCHSGFTLLSRLYSDATICLERKRQKFEAIARLC